MTQHRGLRLPLKRRKDPVLTVAELKVIRELLRSHIAWATREMEARRVSETIIHVRLDAESACAKVEEAIQ